jgi:hypothetical protein
MKTKLFLPVLLVLCFALTSAKPAGFWDLYISGPDSQCALHYGYGTWTIEDMYGDEVDPNNQYEWFIMDEQARQEGYPKAGYPYGRSANDNDRELNADLSFGDGADAIITCKITNNGQTRYEGFGVYSCQ